MCDFRLHSVRSRPAKVSDKLVTRDFGTGTRGFAASDDLGMAVCLLPGTELSFAGDVACLPAGLLGRKTKTIDHQTAIFRQVNKEKLAAHHDALEFPASNQNPDSFPHSLPLAATDMNKSTAVDTANVFAFMIAPPIQLKGNFRLTITARPVSD